MTDTDPIKRAHTLITDLNKAYQACKQASADDVRFQEQLNSILGFLAKAETVDNRFLIELEKFYQTSSLLMGLSALDPDAPTRAAWRAYDRFHFDQVKTKLILNENQRANKEASRSQLKALL
ncbi:BlpT protein, fusion [Streptococcus pneumoniae]|nr:BlpT protein, fusion [Streptococcus pneumoniae]